MDYKNPNQKETQREYTSVELIGALEESMLNTIKLINKIKIEING